MHLFISLLLRGSIISKCSLKMSGKVREFDHDWRVATLNVHCARIENAVNECLVGMCTQSRCKADPRFLYGISDIAAKTIGPETFCTVCEVQTLLSRVDCIIAVKIMTLIVRDLRSFEIRFESAIGFDSKVICQFENFQIISAVPAPLLVVSLVKRLRPLMVLSGTVYRLASYMSDHMPVV